MEKGWEKIYASSQEPRIEMLKGLLSENQIESIIINRQDSFYKTIGELELYVSRDNVLRAIQIVKKATGE